MAFTAPSNFDTTPSNISGTPSLFDKTASNFVFMITVASGGLLVSDFEAEGITVSTFEAGGNTDVAHFEANGYVA